MMCSGEFRCKSMNFRLNDKSCDLNDADRHTHPEDYGPKEGSVYMDTSEKHRKVSLKLRCFNSKGNENLGRNIYGCWKFTTKVILIYFCLCIFIKTLPKELKRT